MNFDLNAYISHLANELVRNFEFGSNATTPVLKGSAKEKEVMRKLEMLLPKFVGVGSGCIIDQNGNASKQMDIVIYEKDLCPVYSINESPDSTYYPCEGVIAAGEIKSTLDSTSLSDIFEKCESVKLLKRQNTDASFRKFGTRLGMVGTKEEEYDQFSKITDQIYFFAVVGSSSLKKDTFLDKIADKFGSLPNSCGVNMICVLNTGIIIPLALVNGAYKMNVLPEQTNYIYFNESNDHNFETLLSNLNKFINNARTVSISAYDKYMNSRPISVNPFNLRVINRI